MSLRVWRPDPCWTSWTAWVKDLWLWAHDASLLLNLLNTWISQATLVGFFFTYYVLPWQQTQHFLIRRLYAKKHFLIKLLCHCYNGKEPNCTELYMIVNGVWPIISPIHHHHALPHVDYSVNYRIDTIVSLTEWVMIGVYNTPVMIQYINLLVICEHVSWFSFILTYSSDFKMSLLPLCCLTFYCYFAW